MKKWITIDSFIVAIVVTLTSGFGYAIPDALNAPEWLSMAICFAVAIITETIGNEIIFSKFAQEKPIRKYLIFVVFILLFLIGNSIYESLYEKTLFSDLPGGFKEVIIFSLISFVISVVYHYYKTVKVKDKYGDAESGFKFSDKDKKAIKNMNHRNKEITGEYDKSLAVKTKVGTFVGEKEEDIVCFKGIPYAKAPIGNLRWKAPEKLENSDKIYEAKYFGPSSIQVCYEGNLLSHHQQSEDCLYLNVYTANIVPEELKPVVVYFHGGDFTYGGSADLLCNMQHYVKSNNNVVAVSFNYRLGLLGYMDFSDIPGGENYKDASNLGLLDQIAALEWVKDNIQNFGGDPKQITVIGDGSGGVSISLLAVCERAKKLFNKAIIVSGTSLCTVTEGDDITKQKQNFMKAASASNMEELLALSEDEIVTLTQKLKSDLLAPKCDGELIPKDVYEAYIQGKAKHIQFILCASKDISNIYSSSIGRGFGEKTISYLLERDISKLNPSVAEKLKSYILDETMRIGKAKAEARFANLWMDQVSMILLSSVIQQGGSSVRSAYWNVDSVIKELGAGDVNFINTLLSGNDAELAYGNVVKESIREILQSLIAKFISGDKLELYNNEVDGVEAIKWEPFPSMLTISNDEIKSQYFDEVLVGIHNLPYIG